MDIITYALAKKIGSPSEAQIESAVDNYLDAHPEATTTVQDGSITKAKLNAELSGKVDEISDINERLGNVITVSETLSESWEIGSYSYQNGSKANVPARIRLTEFVGESNKVHSARSLTGYEFFVLAWDVATGVFVGSYTTEETFGTEGGVKWCTEFDFSAYPEYKFKLALRDAVSPTKAMTVEESVNCLFESIIFNESLISDVVEKADLVDAVFDSSAIFSGFADTPVYNATYYSGGVKEWGTQTKRVINTKTLSYPVKAKLKCASGYTFSVEELDQAYTFTGNKTVGRVGGSGGQVTEYVCPANSNILVILKRSNSGVIDPSEWADAMSIEMYPNDLTQLTDKVGTLQVASSATETSIASIKEKGYISTPYTLESGGINSGSGGNYGGGGDATYLAEHKRTPGYLALEAGTTYIIKAPDSPERTSVAYYRYSASDNSYIGWSGFGTSFAYTANSNEKIRLAFVNDTEEITIADIYKKAIVAPYTPVVQMLVENSGVPTYETPNEFSETLIYSETVESAQPAQGMCTDGTYLYCAKQINNTDAEIIKIDPDTGTVILRNSGTWGHANDIAYDSQNDQLLVMFTTAGSVMAKIDAETLEEVESVDLRDIAHSIDQSYGFVGITYMSDYNRYIFSVVSGSTLVGFAFMTSDFALEKFVRIVPTTHTAQNVDYVNGMIAVSDYNPGNRIIYYNFNGQKINEVLTSYGTEFEALAHIGNDYYLQFNADAYKTLAVYRCTPLGYNYTPMALVQSQYVP